MVAEKVGRFLVVFARPPAPRLCDQVWGRGAGASSEERYVHSRLKVLLLHEK